jgi:hypothetical protein
MNSLARGEQDDLIRLAHSVPVFLSCLLAFWGRGGKIVWRRTQKKDDPGLRRYIEPQAPMWPPEALRRGGQNNRVIGMSTSPFASRTTIHGSGRESKALASSAPVAHSHPHGSGFCFQGGTSGRCLECKAFFTLIWSRGGSKAQQRKDTAELDREEQMVKGRTNPCSWSEL